MKASLTILLSIIISISFGQGIKTDTIQGIKVEYIRERCQLNFDFKNQQSANIIIDWSKYKNIKEISINNYGLRNNSTIANLKKSRIKTFWFSDGNILNFHNKNSIPKRIKKIGIWVNSSTQSDTIFLPKFIEKFKHLSTISLGCCNLISIEQVNLSKLKKLDTLILEGPIYETKSLEKLLKLNYLGIWRNESDSLYGWKTDSISKVIELLFPKTKKEIWCFPPNQSVKMYNGTFKLIQEIVVGDTLLSYNTIEKKFKPNIVLTKIIHKTDNYELCRLSLFNNLLAFNKNSLMNLNHTVTVTSNHPIITSNGICKKVKDLSINESVYYINNNSLTAIQLSNKNYFKHNTELYNFTTKEKNYFVNGFLFSDK